MRGPLLRSHLRLLLQQCALHKTHQMHPFQDLQASEAPKACGWGLWVGPVGRESPIGLHDAPSCHLVPGACLFLDAAPMAQAWAGLNPRLPKFLPGMPFPSSCSIPTPGAPGKLSAAPYWPSETIGEDKNTSHFNLLRGNPGASWPHFCGFTRRFPWGCWADHSHSPRARVDLGSAPSQATAPPVVAPGVGQ